MTKRLFERADQCQLPCVCQILGLVRRLQADVELRRALLARESGMINEQRVVCLGEGRAAEAEQLAGGTLAGMVWIVANSLLKVADGLQDQTV